jgi:hypothetical protein
MRISDVILPREIPDDEAEPPEPAPVGFGDLLLAFLVPIAALFLAIPQLLRDRVGPGLAVLAAGGAGALVWVAVITAVS